MLKKYFQQRFWHWVDRRLPPARSVHLNHGRLFIFPSRQGWSFLLLLLLIWLLGTNYQNNLVLAVAYFLIALFVVCILHTFNNLAGLHIRALQARPVFAGERARFEIRVSRQGHRHRENIHLSWREQDSALVELLEASECHSHLSIEAPQRGWLAPGRLLVETSFPLGLLRAWTWLDMDVRCLVYPRPIVAPLPSASLAAVDDSVQASAVVAGSEDFYGFKSFQPGYSLKHIAWKHYARGGGLYLKQYVDYRAESDWLEWQQTPGETLEQRLSHLCHWVLVYSEQQRPFGLRLPHIQLAPATGEAHKLAALEALALFPTVSRAGAVA